jgi:hypothetical protein
MQSWQLAFSHVSAVSSQHTEYSQPGQTNPDWHGDRPKPIARAGSLARGLIMIMNNDPSDALSSFDSGLLASLNDDCPSEECNLGEK